VQRGAITSADKIKLSIQVVVSFPEQGRGENKYFLQWFLPELSSARRFALCIRRKKSMQFFQL
jgi:hypothetical protein